jgi:lipoate---protein ligase
VGAIPSTRFVSVEELYDYDELRQLDAPTLFIAQVNSATLVLGGNQSSDVVDVSRTPAMVVRRRRGGGGLVLLRPDDLWIDWWIPQGDPRWSDDVRVSSIQVGSWWADALRERSSDEVYVHGGALEGDPTFRVVCFAGRGPGEVFVNKRKAVGLTQWRVREGVFVSTVLHAGPTTDVLEYLNDIPAGLEDALDHHTLASLSLGDRDSLVEHVTKSSGAFHVRPHLFA